jgi:hypothetical protein
VDSKGQNNHGAGIGGGCDNSHVGSITIDSSTTTAISRDGGGAGIGQGHISDVVGPINIYKSDVTAVSKGAGDPEGTADRFGGAGIGGGHQNNGDGGGKNLNIIIDASTISAIASYSGAGIGGGYDSNIGDIHIKDSHVDAHALIRGAGIGGGNHRSAPTNIFIDSGEIIATGGSEGGAGIGGGRENINVKGRPIIDRIIINGGFITAEGGANSTDIGDGHANYPYPDPYDPDGEITTKVNYVFIDGGSIWARRCINPPRFPLRSSLNRKTPAVKMSIRCSYRVVIIRNMEPWICGKALIL